MGKTKKENQNIKEGTITASEDHIQWQPADPEKLNQLIEFGLFQDTERLSLSGQIINKLGEFRYHILKDQSDNAKSPPSNFISRAIHDLSPADYADLELCENQIEAIKVFQPLERLINSKASPQEIDNAIRETENAIGRFEKKNWPLMKLYLPDYESYMKSQIDYCRKKLAYFKQDCLKDEGKIDSFKLQNWLRSNFSMINNEFNGASEYLNFYKRRLKNFFGIRAGKLTRAANDVDKLITNYEFSQNQKITRAHQGILHAPEHQITFTGFDNKYYDVEARKLALVINAIEKPSSPLSQKKENEPEEDYQARIKQEKLNVNLESKNKIEFALRNKDYQKFLRKKEENEPKSIFENIKKLANTGVKFFSRHVKGIVDKVNIFLLKSKKSFLETPAVLAEDLKSWRDSYFYLDPSPSQKEKKTLIAKLQLHHGAKSNAEEKSTEQEAKLSPEDKKTFELLWKIIQKLTTQKTIPSDDPDLVELLKIKRQTNPENKISQLVNEKIEESKHQEKALIALPPEKLTTYSETDLVSSAAKFAEEFVEHLQHDLVKQRPFTATAFFSLYALTFGAAAAPQITGMFLSKLGLSAEQVQHFFHLIHYLDPSGSSSDHLLLHSFISAYHTSEALTTGTDILGNGGAATVLEPLIQALREKSEGGNLDMSLISESLFRLVTAASVFMGTLPPALDQAFKKVDPDMLMEITDITYNVSQAEGNKLQSKLSTLSDKDDKYLLKLAYFFQNSPTHATNFFGNNQKLRNEFNESIVKLTKKYNLQDSFNLEFFGIPPQNSISKLVKGLFKIIPITLGFVLSPLTAVARGLYAAYQAPSGQKWDAFKTYAGGVLSRAGKQFVGYFGNILKTIAVAAGKALKIVAALGGALNVARRLLSFAIFSVESALFHGTREKPGEYHKGSHKFFDIVKTKLNHVVDSIAKFFKDNVIRRFEHWYQKSFTKPEQTSAPETPTPPLENKNSEKPNKKEKTKGEAENSTPEKEFDIVFHEAKPLETILVKPDSKSNSNKDKPTPTEKEEPHP